MDIKYLREKFAINIHYSNLNFQKWIIVKTLLHWLF